MPRTTALILLAALALAPGRAHAEDWIPPANEPAAGPVVSFMRHNAGWQATVSLPEPAVAIAWRLEGEDAWHDTGLLDTIDPRTQRRMPNPGFALDANTPPVTIQVRYRAASGAMPEPTAVAFAPKVELAREQRRILEMLPGSWVSFGDSNGPLLYYTILVSYRCAIEELWVGLDAAKPDRRIDLPACNAAEPNAIPSNYMPLLRVPKGTRSASVQIIYRDGSASAVKQFTR